PDARAGPADDADRPRRPPVRPGQPERAGARRMEFAPTIRRHPPATGIGGARRVAGGRRGADGEPLTAGARRRPIGQGGGGRGIAETRPPGTVANPVSLIHDEGGPVLGDLYEECRAVAERAADAAG